MIYYSKLSESFIDLVEDGTRKIRKALSKKKIHILFSDIRMFIPNGMPFGKATISRKYWNTIRRIIPTNTIKNKDSIHPLMVT